jgi:hypothetical protein
LKEIREYLNNLKNKHPNTANKALSTLNTMERNTEPLSALNMTEADVLHRVWSVTTQAGEEEKKDRMRLLAERMAEGQDENSCASGRVARAVDALSVFDDRVVLRPQWALRRELLDKAAVIAKQPKNNLPLLEKLRQVFRQDYVDPGLVTDTQLDAELNEWGASIEYED